MAKGRAKCVRKKQKAKQRKIIGNGWNNNASVSTWQNAETRSNDVSCMRMKLFFPQKRGQKVFSSKK